MNFKPIHALPFALSVFALTAYAEAPEFADADADRDGVLSIEEAKAALPNLEITDENGDGLVNLAEVKKAVEGLELPASQVADETTAPVGMNEYRMIVQTMQANGQDA